VTPALVLDASSLGGVFFDDEDVDYRDRLLETVVSRSAMVPQLFWYEVRNMVVVGVRRGRADLAVGLEKVRTLRALGLKTVPDPDDRLVFDFVVQHDLTAYDATYAALAASNDLPLATLDKKLISTGRAGAIGLWGV
jgi:predicted nucleic acid-binding protein